MDKPQKQNGDFRSPRIQHAGKIRKTKQYEDYENNKNNKNIIQENS